MFKAIFIIAVLGLVANANCFAEADLDAGADKAQFCAICHGAPCQSANCDSLAFYPGATNLSAKDENGMLAALREYKTGKRFGFTMFGVLTMLDDQDIEDIAAFFGASRK